MLKENGPTDRDSFVGKFDKGIEQARADGWTMVDMQKDWNAVFPAERKMIRVLLAFVLLATLTACEEGPSELRLVTPVGTIDRDIVKELAELFDNERVLTRISLTEESMSGEEALDAIAAGKADVALISNSQEFRRDIATVMPLYPTVLHIARRDGFAEPTAPWGSK